MCGMNKWFQPGMYFHTKAGYHHVSNATSFDDTSNTDEWQKEVYIFVSSFAKKKIILLLLIWVEGPDINYCTILDFARLPELKQEQLMNG